MSALEATRRNMREHMDEPGLVAFSPHTGERCSADHGDYFWLPEDEPLEDENGNTMILARVSESMTILEETE